MAFTQTFFFFFFFDNNYIRTVVNRKHGPVFVPQSQGSRYTKNFPYVKKWLKVTSVTGRSARTKGFAVTKVNDCLYDEAIPVDKDGYYTVAVSRAGRRDRPRNALPNVV